VGAIAAVDPQLNTLVVNNPGEGGLSMNFTQPFVTIGQYVGGNVGNAPTGLDSLDLGKSAMYFARVILIAITGLVAAITVFIMQTMLILQALILAFSKLLLPVFIACLSIPAAKGSAQNFLKSVLGVLAWPIGWAFVHIGTLAALHNLQAPVWTASIGMLVLSFVSLAVVCLWMTVGTIGAPWLIAKAVTSGTNFAGALVGSVASAAGQHASNAAAAGGSVAGAAAGAFVGPGGASVGAIIGSAVGGSLSPIASATQSAEGATGARHPLPSSRSAAAADLAIKGIVKRA
jgi:hypothetical protein